MTFEALPIRQTKYEAFFDVLVTNALFIFFFKSQVFSYTTLLLIYSVSFLVGIYSVVTLRVPKASRMDAERTAVCTWVLGDCVKAESVQFSPEAEKLIPSLVCTFQSPSLKIRHKENIWTGMSVY